MATPAISYAGQVGIGASNPVNTFMEFVSCSLSKTSELAVTSGQRGKRGRDFNRARTHKYKATGQLVLEPCVAELDALLPWLLGGATTSSVTAFTDALAKRFVTVDKVTKVMTYAECVISQWVFEGSEGNPLRLSLDIEGQSETEGNAASFPSLTPSFENFFIFSDLTFAVNSITCTPKSFRLTVNNNLDTERFLNSLTRDEIPSLDRTVNLEIALPYDTVHEPLYDLGPYDAQGVAGSLVLTDATEGFSYTLALTSLKAPEPPIEVGERSELMLNLNYQVFGDHENDDEEFTVTKAEL